ncbi:MAG: urease accessory protein UreF [Alkalilacustris sp.]
MTPARLVLAQWLSPAFPVGGFAYSQGLEWAIAAGEVGTAEALRGWLEGCLAQGAGRSDAILLCLALRDAEGLEDLARALAPSRERLEETEAQGAAFAAALGALGVAVAPAPLPLVVGRAARGLGLEATEVAGLWLQAQACNLIQIAVRLVPLGQGDGQRVLAALQPVILALAEAAAGAGPEDLGAAAFRADLASMRHEVMEVRLCRT